MEATGQVYKVNRTGHKIEPCRTLCSICEVLESWLPIETERERAVRQIREWSLYCRTGSSVQKPVFDLEIKS
jgi:hypothetical protein